MGLQAITSNLSQQLNRLPVPTTVSHVYNPLDYALAPYLRYLELYAKQPEVVLVGMNPGPWGMAQTGVPFGDVEFVRDWLGITGDVGQPEWLHPKRPVLGYACTRKEGSGRRLWGWARDRFGSPTAFFKQFFVVNYCPLIYFQEAGTNLTPDKLQASERQALFALCDAALRATVTTLKPRYVLGVGRFAEQRVLASTQGLDVHCGSIPHPSPASPLANRGWASQVEAQLQVLGIPIAQG